MWDWITAELKSIENEFKNVLAQMPAGMAKKEGGLSADVFLFHFCKLPPGNLDARLGHALFGTIRGSRQEQYVTLGDIIVAKASCLRMGEDAAREFCFKILCRVSFLIAGGTNQEPTLTIERSPLEQALRACLKLALGAEASSSSDCVEAIAEGALSINGLKRSSMDLDCYSRWSKCWPAFHDLLSALIKGAGWSQDSLEMKGDPGTAHVRTQPEVSSQGMAGIQMEQCKQNDINKLLPSLLDLGRLKPEDFLLQPVWSWLVASCLPPDMRREWRCLFSTQRDGKSFNTMMGRLGRCEGPTLLLVKDKEGGHVMGGFASAPWVKNGSYFGDYSTFIFGLYPVTLMYKATGINSNFQWCGMGFSQLPNGCGFGGAQGSNNMGQFALYVDSTLDTGMSRPIATFGNDPLASNQIFQVSVVECWQLKPNEEDLEEPLPGKSGNKKKGSILDRAQDRHILGLAGVKVNNSDGLRPEEPIEE
ncbi:hypothetical protein CEUSTIGMA_g433.t1 [Chlamydomonas eustigma]|uniref:TLDc domain-containing protein n=1 Tax=Chlamydomonas eustigma TaxID=1157962 RepID=A0A250WQB1_9CHLO|nr:hypothetical protein CEUSTIGMA_g433.t1 [Chlamydomonas eustigma]|eukprot:GAX72981.1 hypothetical protein CEUSTIGMA_g433.t1 [Chlamydomonas eustigma]